MRVCLDAGHGGSDAGAARNGVLEKNVTLELALLAEAFLTGQGVDVAQTRRSDVAVGLRERAEVANRAGADLFVSIHVNSHGTATANGIETFISGWGGFRQIAATYVNGEMFKVARKHYNARNRDVKVANFTVLTAANMPAILPEIGFISNTAAPFEHNHIVSGDYLWYMALAIANGILKYFGRDPIPYGFDENGGDEDMVKKLTIVGGGSKTLAFFVNEDGRRVLVGEDNLMNRDGRTTCMSLRALLEEMGIEVDWIEAI